MADPRAGLLEVLLPVLDQLCTDLVDMNESTAVLLDHWPAACEFVSVWGAHMPDVSRETGD